MNNDKYQKELMQRIKKLESSRNDWKSKNKERYEDIKALKMRLKETQESRNRWKVDCNNIENAFKELKQAHEERDAAIANLTKELEDLKKRTAENNIKRGQKESSVLLSDLINSCLLAFVTTCCNSISGII